MFHIHSLHLSSARFKDEDIPNGGRLGTVRAFAVDAVLATLVNKLLADAIFLHAREDALILKADTSL